MKKLHVITLLSAITINLASCSNFPGLQTQQAKVNTANTAKPESSFFPIIKASGPISPVRADIKALRSVTVDMLKEDVYTTIGRQHYKEGFNYSIGNEWDYLFNFKKADSRAFQTCQYKVLFADNERVTAIHWKPESCAKWLNYSDEPEKKQVVEEPVKLVEYQQVEKTNYIFSADGFFDFDKSRISDLKPGGKEKLNNIAQKIKAGGNLVYLNVIGHTDRLGSKAHNAALSESRAASIKNYLIGAGINADVIKTEAVGDARPLVECKQTKRDDALINCLQPNRRFEIEVFISSGSNDPKRPV